MVSRNYMNVVELRKLLLGMEKDLGLGHLSQNEKDIFYAVMSVISDRNGVAKSDEIKNPRFGGRYDPADVSSLFEKSCQNEIIRSCSKHESGIIRRKR